MKNIEKYNDIIIDNTDVCSINRLLLKKNIKGFCSGHSCEGCKDRAIEWLLSEYKEPVLDATEKSYLSAVIRPFRNHVNGVRKWFNGIDYKIIISLDDGGNLCQLPRFPSSSEMYKGMDSKKWYSLQELGL